MNKMMIIMVLLLSRFWNIVVKMLENSRRSGGNYREHIFNPRNIEIKDFENPWNFFCLFGSSDETVTEWMQQNRLLPVTLTCECLVNGHKCGGLMTLKASSNLQGGQLFRCRNNRDHRKATRTNSSFEGSNLTI